MSDKKSKLQWLEVKLEEYEDMVDDFKPQLEELIDYLANKNKNDTDEDEDGLWEEVYSIKAQLAEMFEEITYCKKEICKLKNAID